MMKQTEVLELVRETDKTLTNKDAQVAMSMLDRSIVATNSRGSYGREFTFQPKKLMGYMELCGFCGKPLCPYSRWVTEEQ